jgi:hypothetical protein
VRTRRSSRSSRGWTTGNLVQGFRSGLDGKNERAECRVDSVKHSTSPSHRGNARRAITSPVFSKPVCRYRTSACSTAAPPRTSVCRLQHVHDLRVPNPRIVGKHLSSPCLIPLVRNALNASTTPGNLDTEQPLSYCYELPTQLRLESVANAHTAADLHVRSWVSYRAGQESLERRERVTNTPSAISDNP